MRRRYQTDFQVFAFAGMATILLRLLASGQGHELELAADGPEAGFYGDAPIGTVGLQKPGLDIVGKSDGENLFAQAILQ